MSTRSATYWARHPDSPIAKACSDVGAVRVSDTLRADIAHRVSTRDLRRAYALGVISATDGLEADVHQHASGLWPDLSPADYLAEWVTVAGSWSTTGGSTVAERPDDEEAERAYHAECVARYAADLAVCAPVWYREWLERTVHAPKWEMLIELGAAQWLGAGPAATRRDGWADKVLRQWATRCRRGDGATMAERVADEF